MRFFRATAVVITLAANAHATAPELPLVPSVARVHIEVGRSYWLVVQDVTLPRGEWRAGSLFLYVAFGGPGTPRALDAHLIAMPQGALEAKPEARGEPLGYDRVSHKPSGAIALLGRPTMAGVTIHVPEAAFRRALSPSGMATLRIRTLLPRGDEASREVLVRLGMAEGTPLTLGRVQAAGANPDVTVRSATASLCGPYADAHPLSVYWAGKRASVGALAPVLATRHASDDLCVRVE